MKSKELNVDGLIGPTHNYSGLSFGNIASTTHQKGISNPKEAALQGLDKMHLLMHHGITQLFLPPQERPHIATLKQLGFYGSDEEIIKQVFKSNPELLYACSSASSMWAANAATVSPSIDSKDSLVHFTPANLAYNFHRSLEAYETSRNLRKIFPAEKGFIHHHPLPVNNVFFDEGAANHTRFCQDFGKPGVQLFVFGRYVNQKQEQPIRYPARSTFEAAEALVRLHKLNKDAVVFAKQNPKAVDAGVFHNDVISVGNQHLFFFHEEAFENTNQVILELQDKFHTVCNSSLVLIKVKKEEISLEDAVKSYLFNSQIVTLAGGEMMMLAPTECLEIDAVKNYLNQILNSSSNPITRIEFFNLRESMKNGGGPACLRLRVVLTEEELSKVNPKYILTEELYLRLKEWIHDHYRDHLKPEDLGDPQVYLESQVALDKLNSIWR